MTTDYPLPPTPPLVTTKPGAIQTSYDITLFYEFCSAQHNIPQCLYIFDLYISAGKKIAVFFGIKPRNYSLIEK